MNGLAIFRLVAVPCIGVMDHPDFAPLKLTIEKQLGCLSGRGGSLAAIRKVSKGKKGGVDQLGRTKLIKWHVIQSRTRRFTRYRTVPTGAYPPQTVGRQQTADNAPLRTRRSLRLQPLTIDHQP